MNKVPGPDGHKVLSLLDDKPSPDRHQALSLQNGSFR